VASLRDDGWHGAADIHHVIRRGEGGSDEIENLIGLCRECHKKAHAGGYSKELLTAKHEMFMELHGVYQKIKDKIWIRT
jgi:5-methylcytosine-specific restriction endonuclease McrA